PSRAPTRGLIPRLSRWPRRSGLADTPRVLAGRIGTCFAPPVGDVEWVVTHQPCRSTYPAHARNSSTSCGSPSPSSRQRRSSWPRVAMTGALAAEVLAGAPADVVLSATEAYLKQLHDAGLVPRPAPFARNRLAILVRSGATDRVHSLDDLTRDDVRRLVFPAANDPCGAYTVELFARAGLAERMAEQRAQERLIVLDLGGRSMSDLLESGEIDAIVAYRTIASRLPQFRVVELPPPLEMRDRILFTVGTVVRDGAHTRTPMRSSTCSAGRTDGRS